MRGNEGPPAANRAANKYPMTTEKRLVVANMVQPCVFAHILVIVIVVIQYR
jgi:hypothetical protein